MPKGKLLRYPKAQDLLDKGMAYINDRKTKKEPILYSGLLLALGIDRSTLNDYEHRDTHRTAVQQLKLEVQAYIENQAYKGKSPIFPIFALKNFGWIDKQEIGIESTEPITIAWTGFKKKK